LISKGAIWKFSLAFIIGLLVGYKIIPAIVVAGVYLLLLSACILYAAQANVEKVFAILPYCIYTEILIRANVTAIPYLMMQYEYCIVFGLLLFTYGRHRKPHTKVFYIMIGFLLLEYVNGFFPDRPLLQKALFTNTLSLTLAATVGSYISFTPRMINKILAGVKIGAVYLAGIIFVAHLKGNISYGNFSNSESSNGLAPVQLSGYLGFASAMMLISIMNPEERKQRIVNNIVFAAVTIIMILTFSRGGLYFVGAIAGMYLVFNRKSFGNYFKYLILIPVGMIVFNTLVSETGGALEARYEAKGSSNRDVLVEAAWKVFLENPVFGVGTGNYNTAIVRYGFFSEESTAHNEFARVLAEHGVFGGLFYWGFFIALIVVILQRPEPKRQFSLYFLALFCFITIHNGLKISVQQLLVVLAVANPAVTAIKRKNTIHVNRQLTTLPN